MRIEERKEGSVMDSDFRCACLHLFGLTFQIAIKDGQPIVVTTLVREQRAA